VAGVFDPRLVSEQDLLLAMQGARVPAEAA
jgi:hypothetical protein